MSQRRRSRGGPAGADSSPIRSMPTSWAGRRRRTSSSRADGGSAVTDRNAQATAWRAPSTRERHRASSPPRRCTAEKAAVCPAVSRACTAERSASSSARPASTSSRTSAPRAGPVAGAGADGRAASCVRSRRAATTCRTPSRRRVRARSAGRPSRSATSRSVQPPSQASRTASNASGSTRSTRSSGSAAGPAGPGRRPRSAAEPPARRSEVITRWARTSSHVNTWRSRWVASSCSLRSRPASDASSHAVR